MLQCRPINSSPMVRQPGRTHYRGCTISHPDTAHSIGLLWTSDQLIAETSIWQHTTLTRNRHLCRRWDSIPKSQEASGRIHTPRPRGHRDWPLY